MTATQWRPMTAADLDSVVAVARAAFPDHFEAKACFAERLRLYPAGCFALASDAGVLVGYLISYPWLARSAPPLNSLIEKLPEHADVLYLHDLALHPDARGKGYTHPIVEHLVAEAAAAGWSAISLVSVNQAAPFWSKHGFVALEDQAMAEKLASYGEGAAFMMRRTRPSFPVNG